MYIRIVVLKIDESSQCRQGVVQAAAEERYSGRLARWQEILYHETAC